MAERLAGSEYCEDHVIRPPDLSGECKYCQKQDLLKTTMKLQEENRKLREDNQELRWRLQRQDATIRRRELQLGLKPE